MLDTIGAMLLLRENVQIVAQTRASAIEAALQSLFVREQNFRSHDEALEAAGLRE